MTIQDWEDRFHPPISIDAFRGHGLTPKYLLTLFNYLASACSL